MVPEFLLKPCCCKALKHGLDFCPACGISLYESKLKEINQTKIAFDQKVK